jgi:AcrR family transcriptional regulator
MATKPNSKSQRRAPLSRERVLNAAIGLADKGGIESLTMRKLAGELGVEAMSLYNHVANKGDLVDAMVGVVIGEIDLPSAAEEWDAAIRKCAISAHDVLMRHPWACSLMMSPTTTGAVPTARLVYMEWLLRQLREAGFSADLTYHAYHALDGHILGFTMWELGHSAAATNIAAGKDFADVAEAILRDLRPDYPQLAAHGEQHLAAPSDEGPSEFEFGLDLLLDGLKRLHEAAR